VGKKGRSLPGCVPYPDQGQGLGRLPDGEFRKGEVGGGDWVFSGTGRRVVLWAKLEKNGGFGRGDAGIGGRGNGEKQL